jgi:hypothetical protein
MFALTFFKREVCAYPWGVHPWGTTSPLGINFSPGGKHQTWERTHVVKNWPESVWVNLIRFLKTGFGSKNVRAENGGKIFRHSPGGVA